jgi:hypothetical protein
VKLNDRGWNVSPGVHCKQLQTWSWMTEDRPRIWNTSLRSTTNDPRSVLCQHLVTRVTQELWTSYLTQMVVTHLFEKGAANTSDKCFSDVVTATSPGRVLIHNPLRSGRWVLISPRLRRPAGLISPSPRMGDHDSCSSVSSESWATWRTVGRTFLKLPPHGHAGLYSEMSAFGLSV